MKLLFCFVLFLSAETQSAEVRYNNYKVYHVIPRTNTQVQQLHQLRESGLKVDFWKCTTLKDVSCDIMVPPYMQAKFQDVLNNLKIDYSLFIEDVQKLIDRHTFKPKGANKFDWSNYYTLDQINNWLHNLTRKYPEQVESIIGGRSYEGRDIKGVKVSYKEGNKGVFIEGGIHAREWISPATVTYILNEILTSTDANVRDMAKNYDWYIFPSVNPDGYVYTHTTDRLWRMTRQPHGSCIGADPNRNWGYHWNEGGNTSNNTCDQTYAGPFPFSEPEMKSLSEYITKIHDKLIGYLSIHSYSQLLLIPYGYTTEHLDNFDEMLEIGKKAVDSLSQRYGTKFVVGNMAETIYVATGVSPDWAKGNLKIPITYTYELRDTGKHGFVLPPDQIIPSGEELLDSLVTMMQEAKLRGYH